MSPVHNFFKCEKCGKELNNTNEQKAVVDNDGMTRVYCHECYEQVKC